MTISGATPVYRYVADGELVAASSRESMVRLRRVLWAVVPVGLLVGLGLSLAVNAASVPNHLGEVLVIGAAWGLLWVLAVLALFGVVVPLARLSSQRQMARMFSDGSLTEVELDEDFLVIRRPTGARSVPYRSIFRISTRGSFLRVERRGHLMAELLPLGLLPESAIELIRLRSRGLWPQTVELGAPDREWMVPTSWSAHVAAVVTGDAVRGARFWARCLLAFSASVLLAAGDGPLWLVLAPTLAILSLARTYAGTRRAVASALPTGSVASTEFLEDRFISRNSGGVREIRFGNIHRVKVRHDVVLLRLLRGPKMMAIAQDLVPEDQLERLLEPSRHT